MGVFNYNYGNVLAMPLDKDQAELNRLRLENAGLKRKMAEGRFFTKQELIDHDLAVRKDERKREINLMKAEAERIGKELNRNSDEYFKHQREIWLDDCKENRYLYFMSYCFGFIEDTLVQDFGWKYPQNHNYADMRFGICKLFRGILERVQRMSEQPDIDMEMYAEQMSKKYGIAFGIEDEEE